MTVAGNTAGTGNNPLSGLQNTLGNLFGGNNQTQNQTQNQQQTSSANTADFTTNNDTGLQIRTVYPPITPDKLVGVYDAPVPTLSLPNLKLDKITTSNVKNKNISGYLKAIEQKITATEKLMKDIVKLQNLQIVTEKEVSERKSELYQNTFEEYLLDKTVDFRDKKKKSCTCINLPDKAPAAPPIVAPIGGGSPAPTTVPDTSTSAQPSTTPAPAPAPTPSPIFDPGGFQDPQFSPNTPPAPKQAPPGQLPPWLNLPPIPIPPIPRLPDLEGLGGLASEKMGDYGKLFGIDATSFASVIAKLKPIGEKLKQPITEENKKALIDNALAIAEGAGMTAQQAMMLITALFGAAALAVGQALTGLEVPNYAKGAIVPYASGGLPGGDLELYSAESQSYFRDISNKISNQIASDVPVGPHTPLPHPGYVKPQGSFIPKPNLRGMPGPTGKSMPWGYDPTKMLAKGGLVQRYADGGSWLPGTGKVMSPKTVGNTTVAGYQNKFLGIPIGNPTFPRDSSGYSTGYSQAERSRYEQKNSNRQFINAGGPFPKLVKKQNVVADAFSNFGSNVQTIQSAAKRKEEMMRELGYEPDGYVNLLGTPVGKKAGGGILSQLNKFNPMAHLLQLSDKVRSTLIPAPKVSKPKIGSLPASARQVTQYPEGVSTGVGGGNMGAYVPNKSSNILPMSSPITKQSPQTPVKVDPFASELDQYNTLIKQGKTEEAEALGQQIWSRKYADTSMTRPKTDNPLLTNNLEKSQNKLTSNSSTKQNTIPLPPDYIKIPGKKNTIMEKNDDTMLPPPGISRPAGPFTRDMVNFDR